MKKTFLFCLLLLVLLSVSGCRDEPVRYVRSQSAVTAVSVEGGRLTISALIVLENRSGEAATFVMTGNYSALTESETVADADLPAIDDKGFSEQLTIPPKTTLCLHCTFRGTLKGALPEQFADTSGDFLPPPDALTFTPVTRGYTEDE